MIELRWLNRKDADGKPEQILQYRELVPYDEEGENEWIDVLVEEDD